ncbi:MAG: hypothetical protein IPL61_40355 [Myxococcales bacterium]|nr:hypothetical protein [Myxococcales bacterium]
MRRTITLGALLAVACSGGPRKVGGQPSWRASPGEDATAASPAATPEALRLAPASAGAAAYNDPPRSPAPASPLGDAIAAEIAALAPPSATPLADGRMYGAAADLAAIIPSEGVMPYPLVEFALQHHGIIEPSPNMLVVWGPLDQTAMLVEHLRPRLAEILHAEPQRRFGVGTADRGDRAAIIVMLQASFVDTQPIPRALALAGHAALTGTIAPGFVEPEAFVTGTDGKVRRVALAVATDGSFAGELRCPDRAGRHQVEIAASDRTGSTVLANFPLWCGQTPPAELVAAVDPDDATPVTSVDGAEARLLAMLNRDRAAAGLPALAAEPAVAAVARAHSVDMRDHGFVGHVSPTTGSAADRADAAGILSGVILENIARAYGPAEAQAGLMNSPGHRANALSTAATHVGIGVALGAEVAGRRELFVTQMFIRIPPPLDPVAAHAFLVERFTAGTALTADPLLDRLAGDFAAALARGVPHAEARRAVTEGLDAQAGRYRQAANVVTAVSDLDAVVAKDLLGDLQVDRIGIGVAQGPHPDLGPGAYWLVLVLARSR